MQLFYDLMKIRDQGGESMFTHFIQTKQFIVLEARTIQKSVQMLWIGSGVAESAFMENSVAF